MRNQTKLITTIGLIVIVAALAVGVTISTRKASSTVSSNTPAVSASPSGTTAPAVTTTASATEPEYKDGTYTASGSYNSPGGTQSISISVTLTGDKVTATSATAGATDHESSEYQSDFISGYQALVVGKSLDSLSLSRVSGSSLTSTGFNNAIATIKTQAKAS